MKPVPELQNSLSEIPSTKRIRPAISSIVMGFENVPPSKNPAWQDEFLPDVIYYTYEDALGRLISKYFCQR